MSLSDLAKPDVRDSARDFAAACAEAIDAGRPDAIPDEAVGQVIGAAIRLYAEKIQAGGTPRPVAGNAGLGITDVCIACTALMDEVGLELFELGSFQMMSGLGKRPQEETP